MKLPFGSRSSRVDDEFDDLDVEDFDDDADADDRSPGFDDLEGLFDAEVPARRPDLPAPSVASAVSIGVDDDLVSSSTGHAVPPPEGRSGRLLRRPRRTRHDEDEELEEPVTADDFSTEMERLRSEASAEQRSAWAYLGVLTGLFGVLVLFGYGCSDQGESEVATGEAVEVQESGQPAQLVFQVDGDIITLQGTVPNEAARGQLLTLAQNAYGPENVLDELTVDADVSFEAGTIRTVGSAAFDDGRAQQLHDAIGRDFGLANRGFEVGFVETVLAPVNALVEIADGRVTLSGGLPDQASIDDLVQLTGDVWGPTNVDASRLTVGETTWTDGRIRLSGRAASTDQRIQEFTAAVPDRLGLLVTVDTAGLVVDDVTELLAEVRTEIDTVLATNPIQFEPLSAEIDPASDAVVAQLAELLGQLPTTDFEVVGYTDSVGDDQENLLLSQERAQAVVDRLGELGVDPARMTSRGEGENDPVADNGTDEGRAANRRIEFVFVGEDLTDDATTTTTSG
ncbi:MAG: OmpA family protein [Actinomycetota bacterium]